MRKRETNDALKIMCNTFDFPFLRPSEEGISQGVPKAASEETNNPKPPDTPDNEKVHVNPTEQPEPQERPISTRRLPRRLEMDSKRKKYLIVYEGGCVVDALANQPVGARSGIF